MPTRTPLAALALVAVLVAGCGASATAMPTASTTRAPSAAPSRTAERTATPTAAPTSKPTPKLTPVPGAASDEPQPPAGGRPGTTVTDWGTILDAVPGEFPLYPGAEPAELPEGPNSGAWSVGADVEAVSTWYRDRLKAAGFTHEDLSSALEDGSRTLDITTDLPECRIQLTFRPTDGSTMIVAMYGAGCAGGDG